VGDVAPVDGDLLNFAGGTGTGTVVQNAYPAGTLFNGISFEVNAGPFTIGTTAQPIINLGGDLVSNSLQAQTINNPLALTATRTANVASQFGSLTLGGVISETAAGFGITKTGNGLLTLSNAGNTFTGPISINAGTLAFGADTTGAANPLGNGTAGAGTITLDGGILRATAAGILSTNRAITLGASGGTFDQLNSNTTAYNGVISGGANSFTKTGQGTLTLGGLSTYTGNTVVNQGTLRLDFAGLAAATTTNLINPASALIMGGIASGLSSTTSTTAAARTLDVRSEGNATAVSQTFASATFAPGTSFVTTTQTSGLGDVLLNLGALTHQAGGFVNFSRVGALSAVNSITTTTPNNAAGILGGWATFGGTDYAVRDGAGNIVPLAVYTVPTGAAPVIPSAPTSNVRLDNTSTGNPSLAAGVTDINTLSISDVATRTLNIGAGNTLRLGAQGGILGATGAGVLVVGVAGSAGTLTAGGADDTAGEINIFNFASTGVGTTGSTGRVDLNAVIADNGLGAVRLSTGQFNNPAANNSVNLNSVFNTYSGGTIITSGRVTANANPGSAAANNAAFGTGPVTVLNGAQAFLSNQGIYANAFNIAGNGTSTADTSSAIRFGANGITLTGTITLLGDAVLGLRATNTNVISGQITGGYNLSILGRGASGGSITLSNPANNYTGNLTIGEERVILGASNVLTNGAGVGNVILNNDTTAILDLNGKNETINGLSSVGGNGFVQNGTLAADSTTTNGTTSTLTLGDGDASAAFGAVIRDNGNNGTTITNLTGTVAVTKIGSGTQFLNNANTYTGGTTVKAGVLFRGANTNPFGTGAITLGDTAGAASATLRFSNVGNTTSNPINVVAGSSGAKTIDTVGTGQTFTFSGPVTLADTLNLSTYAGNTNQLTVSGAISGVGALNANAGGASITVSGTNSFSGGTNLTRGNLLISTPLATLGTGPVNVLATAISLTIQTGVVNAIADNATLTLAGGGSPRAADFGYATLSLGVNETVGGLILGNSPQLPGFTYGSSASTADIKSDEFFSGNGVITVVPEPSALLMLASAVGGLLGLQRRRRPAR
jgi:autotransporter-associated beta strand protein